MTIRVAVVFGGTSSEHTISCATAAGVLTAIDRDRFQVVPVGITKTGQWLLVSDDPQRWTITSGQLPEVVEDDGIALSIAMGAADPLRITADPANPAAQTALPVDVVLPLLHGPFGEDGTIQGLLELAGLAYAGSGVFASAAGMDKHHMKVALAGAGIPIGDYVTVTARQWHHDGGIRDRIGALGLPVFVKPARAGSSMGITRVDDLAQLDAAMATAHEHDPKVIVEAGISGREIECAVLGGRAGAATRASGVGEIVVGSDYEFYDYQAKYFDSEHLDIRVPADVPGPVLERMRALAIATFEALDCEGLARVDFFYTTDGEVLVNEINTMPGFTPYSMYPMLWQQQGWTYSDLITELIELALQRPTGLR
ncbi:MAG: D-alanine--D-alanine ligase family protein [Beutenbergiaceae bacterium]